QRLDLALAQEQALDRVERLLASLERIEGLPGRLVHRHVEQSEEGGHDGSERAGERQDLSRDLLLDLPRVVAVFNLEVAAVQLDHRKVGGGLAVRDRGGLQDEPAVHAVGVGELPEETRFAYARLPDHGDHLAVPLAGPVKGARSASSSAFRPTKRVSPRRAAASRRVRAVPATSSNTSTGAPRPLTGTEPSGVIFMGDRRAEERHDAVAQELVHRPLVAMDLGEHELERAAHDLVYVLGIDPRGTRR